MKDLKSLVWHLAAADHANGVDHEIDVVGETCQWCLMRKGGADEKSLRICASAYLKAFDPWRAS